MKLFSHKLFYCSLIYFFICLLNNAQANKKLQRLLLASIIGKGLRSHLTNQQQIVPIMVPFKPIEKQQYINKEHQQISTQPLNPPIFVHHYHHHTTHNLIEPVYNKIIEPIYHKISEPVYTNYVEPIQENNFYENFPNYQSINKKNTAEPLLSGNLGGNLGNLLSGSINGQIG